MVKDIWHLALTSEFYLYVCACMFTHTHTHRVQWCSTVSAVFMNIPCVPSVRHFTKNRSRECLWEAREYCTRHLRSPFRSCASGNKTEWAFGWTKYFNAWTSPLSFPHVGRALGSHRSLFRGCVTVFKFRHTHTVACEVKWCGPSRTKFQMQSGKTFKARQSLRLKAMGRSASESAKAVAPLICDRIWILHPALVLQMLAHG